ncbi:NAD/NADP octopine/nopaline dehydrogenase family protein [Butyricimonas paravirosa]|uniref:NAD/NADP octopine/nopaline dehydrogenase family protein n=1 Tax=Butyricimonas paravirosa TaxID=1472417 RepID=UPI00210E8784|nr:NAD/NADP octopine/nopaline dehydrogenase family protein [Butyricimonas paravirosa]MCQ4873747.1 NAD/NADP octopine/nopaline dehydrogenase family protein [Butyricimonas paravirosa]
MIIGIYGLGSQSGLAYFADMVNRGYTVIGYNRPSINGNSVINVINKQGGVYLERPENSNNERSHFIPLDQSQVTNDLNILVEQSDIIIITLPSIYQVASVEEMEKVGIKKRQVPLILSPSRTIATPYIWKILGEQYPVVCFSTCPYSCKVPVLGTSLIKRRKRTWMVSLEGRFNVEQKNMLRELFPQAALSKIPALTSLNNIGAVFHCATYLLNYDEIKRKESVDEIFSFYMDGIAKRPEVGVVLEQIDQIRLQIASKLGLSTFGLKDNPREDVWRKLTNGLRALEEEYEGEIDILRKLRRLFSEYLNTSILSSQHWLDITYGVIRIEGESLSDTIGRTPTYQKNSVPQLRYMTEDIPTGLVPLERLAKYLDVDSFAITNIIDEYERRFDPFVREKGRNLMEFNREYVIQYLKGEL